MNYVFTYRYYIFIALAVTFVTYFLANLLQNPYQQINARLAKGVKKINKKGANANIVKYMDKTYKMQWNVFCRSQLARPSQVMLFDKQNFVYRLNLLYVFATIIALGVGYYGIVYTQDVFLFVAVAFVLASYIGFSLVNLHKKRCTKRAQQQFAKFVVQLNKNFYKKEQTSSGKIDKLKTALHQDTLQKAQKILQENGLNKQRTAQEQQKMNVAMNGLLQAYARAQQN